jgi:UDP-N-acetylglucosamine 2-epimerase (non-hydrolysing)
MKILTITGTRPELIRLAVILDKLDKLTWVKHVHVYTNQNYDPNLSTIFLKDLGIRTPDYTLKKTNGIGEFLGNGFSQFNDILEVEKPDKVLVLGDTNSGLLSILAAKKGIPVYHMEAGNRCYDGVVPEETNRKVIDAASLFNLPYTENSKTNLVNEGFHKNFIFKTGNPIKEVLMHYMEKINASKILKIIGLASWEGDGLSYKPYVLLTFHRTENVDNKRIALDVMCAVNKIANDMPVVFPLHPRTKDQFERHGVKFNQNVRVIDPIGFFDFVNLEKHASLVITDSGTVPEETSLFHVPCIVLRNTTERQELMENGSLILAGTKYNDIIQAYDNINKVTQKWEKLDDYEKLNVSDTIVRLLVGQSVSITRKGHDEY